MAQLAPAEVDVVIERALAELPFDDWQIIDTRSEDKGPRADFVVVGPPGVFVIGCGRRHEKERAHAKELMRLLEVAHQVAEVAGVRRDEVHPVLCLTGDQPEDSWSRGVTVCGIVNLADTLVFKRDRLNRDEVEAAALAVGRTMRAGGQAPRLIQSRSPQACGERPDACSRFGAGSSAWRSPLTSSVTSASSRHSTATRSAASPPFGEPDATQGRPPFQCGGWRARTVAA